MHGLLTLSPPEDLTMSLRAVIRASLQSTETIILIKHHSDKIINVLAFPICTEISTVELTLDDTL